MISLRYFLFLVIGAGLLSVDIVLMYLLTEIVGWNFILTFLLVNTVTLFLAFICRQALFQTTGNFKHHLLIFINMALLNWFIVSLIVRYLPPWTTHLHKYGVILAVALLMSVPNYLLNKHIAFRSSEVMGVVREGEQR